MTPRFITRPPTLSDVSRMTALRNAANVSEVGTPEIDESDMRSLLETPGFVPDIDALLVFASSGDLVGYLSVWADPPFTKIQLSNFVHPDWKGQGIGSLLLDRSEHRAKQVADQAKPGAAVVLFQGIWREAHAAKRFFERRGYDASRHFDTMEIEMTEPPPTPSWPAGIEIRTLRPGTDDRNLYEATREVFASEWAFTDPPFEAWKHDVLSSDKFDPALHFLAMDGDQIAGFALCTAGEADNPEGAYIADLGVRTPWRRRGLGLALLHHAFGTLYPLDRRRVTLGVDSENPTGAVRLYERAGMHPTQGGTIFERELIAGETRR